MVQPFERTDVTRICWVGVAWLASPDSRFTITDYIATYIAPKTRPSYFGLLTRPCRARHRASVASHFTAYHSVSTRCISYRFIKTTNLHTLATLYQLHLDSDVSQSQDFATFVPPLIFPWTLRPTSNLPADMNHNPELWGRVRAYRSPPCKVQLANQSSYFISREMTYTAPTTPPTSKHPALNRTRSLPLSQVRLSLASNSKMVSSSLRTTWVRTAPLK